MKRAGGPIKPSSPKRTMQKFRPEYSLKYPCITKSEISEFQVKCVVCDFHFKISSGGINDCKRHVESLTHKENSRLKTTAISMKTYFSSKTILKQPPSTIRAELIMLVMIVYHNLPFAAMDTLSRCAREAFTDSAIAAGFKCARTKATCLIKELASLEVLQLVERMKKGPFSLSTDGSNDQLSGAKHYPIVITLPEEDGIATRLLSLSVCDGHATGKNIFTLLSEELAAHEIPWSNCLALGMDNAPVMSGQKNGVIAFAEEQNPSIFKAGCCIHLAHIGARKGIQKMGCVEEALIETFCYFKKSALRKSELGKFQDLYDLESKKCLKHVQTRWLSISRDYFLAEKGAAKSALGKSKAAGLAEFYKSRTNRLRAMFQLYYTQLFNPVLLTLQTEHPQIHSLLGAMEALLKSLLSKVIRPDVLLTSDIIKINPADESIHKADSELGIGVNAMDFVSSGELQEKKLKEFFKEVKMVYTEAIIYLQKSLPWDNQLLKAIGIVDPSQQVRASQADLLFLLRRFPVLCGGLSLDELLCQFDIYKCTDITTSLQDRPDKTWSSLKTSMPSIAGLCDVMLGLLTIPHSSASCERLFSLVRRNLTEQRPSLGDKSLEALLILKTGLDFEGLLQRIKGLDQAALDMLKSATKAQLG